LLPVIVADMIRAGTSGTWGNGQPTVNGVVIGFMAVIGRAVTILCMTATIPNIVTPMEDR
jgi:hypothetical protein